MDKFNWIRKYNDLFETINQQNSEAYFSGPRFLGIIREFDETYADYQQFIAYRNEKGLSTSRKTYFFDILSQFQDDVRDKIIERIYEVANKAEKKPIEKTVEKEVSELAIKIEKEEKISSSEVIENPSVFISYSWDNEEHKNWVLNLAKRLRENGIEVILDRYELQGGKNIAHFMDRALENADKVLVIFTPNYKLKADKREGGVGYEYSILNNDIYKNIAGNSKYIPVLKSGTMETSVPAFIQQFIAIDVRDDAQYEQKVREITLTLYDKPIIKKPGIGKKPRWAE
ncbi:toll/interleukin-1 receptor domain-containing protein [Cellulophaga baltica]|uniref:toll/interleukin-1 receptor domain-containing protein n=1 Tax=Cellulophaga baltica TaxID=76594 RepID=UPI0004183A38|nr:toll/interleukin-1 receptor domain-containing protein [Cellulophaga baltica]